MFFGRAIGCRSSPTQQSSTDVHAMSAGAGAGVADADATGGAEGGEGADAGAVVGGAADAAVIGGTSRAADAEGAGVLCGARDDEQAPVIAIAKSTKLTPRTLRAGGIAISRSEEAWSTSSRRPSRSRGMPQALRHRA